MTTPSPPSDERHGPLGRLYAADGASVPVSIHHNQDDVLLVVLEDARIFLSRSMTRLTLESSGTSALLRTTGYGMRIDGNMLRFVEEDSDEDIAQRREFVRVPAVQRVILRDRDSKVLAITLTVDISGGGMLVKLPSTLAIDGPVNFELSIHGSDAMLVTGSATVARAREDDQRALAFTKIAHADRERLIRFIFDCQRRALAIIRREHF